MERGRPARALLRSSKTRQMHATRHGRRPAVVEHAVHAPARDDRRGHDRVRVRRGRRGRARRDRPRCDPYTNHLLTGETKNDTLPPRTSRHDEALRDGRDEFDVHDVLNVFMCTGFTRDTQQYFTMPARSRSATTPSSSPRPTCSVSASRRPAGRREHGVRRGRRARDVPARRRGLPAEGGLARELRVGALRAEQIRGRSRAVSSARRAP